jgi:hypothetical protein
MFPLRRLYFLVIFILTLLSPIGLSLQTDDINSLPWKISATIQITSITITFLLLAWLPLLIPWLVSLSPRLQNFFTGLRESGIEEIEAGILRIKLSPGLQKAVETYKNVVDLHQPKASEKEPGEIEKLYREALSEIKVSKTLSSSEAMNKIRELSQNYDRIRSTLPSSSRRTQLLEDLSAILWSLMPSTENFPVREWLNSSKGGERLSAYKYLEHKPNLDYLDLLLSRAVGILEEPFGQYSALLAFRRMTINSQPTTAQRELIITHLRWSAQLEYMGRDRMYLMNSIVAALEKKT